MSQFLFFYLRVSQNKVTLRLKENFNISPFDKNALLRISALPPPPATAPFFEEMTVLTYYEVEQRNTKLMNRYIILMLFLPNWQIMYAQNNFAPA